uniref:thymidine kinase n=1 Tax=viral metagenome TaxID=1070528 RepID=A0A6C0EU60_9ZZZZ
MALHITVGCMFSSKTSTLMNKYHTLEVRTIIIDFDITQKEFVNGIMTNHTNLKLPCIKCTKLYDIQKYDKTLLEASVIMINEAQFFPDLVPFVKEQLSKDKIIYVYGLDGDYKQEKIGTILDLVPLCDTIQKLKANCSCGNYAIFSHRESSETEQYLPNAKYVPVCRKCNL